MACRWSDFEKYVWWECWYSGFPRGWTVEYQKRLLGIYRIDFAAWKGNNRAVGDAKDKGELYRSDIDKLLNDAAIFKASTRILFIASDTGIGFTVLDFCHRKNVQIVRTDW